MDAMKGVFQDGVERSSFGYRILRSNLDSSLQLASEMLRNSTFPDEELTKLKARIAAYLSNLEKAPARASRSLFDRMIYGADTPMGAVWTPELLEQVDKASLENFHEKEIAPDNMTIYMIGDIGIEEAMKSLNKAFGRWNAKADSSLQTVGKAQAAKRRVVLVDYPGAASSTIVAGHSVAPYNAESWTEISIMNRVFGGSFESRLNMNLREDKGWSYGYRSNVDLNTSGDMTLQAAGQVQTDKTAESMQEILSEFEAFVSTRPATTTEVDRMKLNRVRSRPGSFSTNRGFLGSIVTSDSYGLPYDSAQSAAERFEAVTAEGVEARARAMIDPAKISWLIVGDLEKIEDSVRALKYGDVEVWDAFGKRLR